LKLTLPAPIEKMIDLFSRYTTILINNIKAHPYDFLLFDLIIIYGIIFSYFTVLKHNLFNSYAWDLGVFNQALYTTLYNGSLLYYTADLFLNPTGCYFAQHISPILFLVLPVYAIHPSSVTLLVFKSFVLGIGALPLYLSARNILKSEKAGFMLAIVYLMYPPLQGANWFDFQQQVFIPFFFFLLYYFMINKKWKLFFFIVALTLAVTEQLAIIVFLFAGYFLISERPHSILESIKFPNINKNLALLITIIICIMYLPTAIYIKNIFPINPDFLERYKALGHYSILGIKGDPLLLPLYALLNPQNAFQAIIYDYHVKFFYIILLFGPLLFVSLRSKLSLVTILLLAPFLLSNYRAYYTVGAHYPLYILAFVFIAAIDSLAHLKFHTRFFTLKTMIVVALFFMISTSPISPMSTPFIKNGLLWYPEIDLSSNEKVNSLHNVIDLIPHNASVLTQNHIFPHVSNRINAYVLPLNFVGGEKYVRTLINKSEFILLDVYPLNLETKFVIDKIVSNGNFGIYALASDAILFKRDYKGKPMFEHFTEDRSFLAYKDFFVSPLAEAVHDPTTKSEKVILLRKRQDEKLVVFGPYTYLCKGIYTATFMIKAKGYNESFHIATLDISYDNGKHVISKRDIFSFELKTDKWKNFTISFAFTSLKTGVEFRVFSSGKADLYVDKVVIHRTFSTAKTEFGVKTFTSKDLVLVDGYINPGGLFVHQQNVTSLFAWYGPYESLPPGCYNVTFFLRVAPIPDDCEKIITLDVVADIARTFFTAIDVYSLDFLDVYKTDGWQMFTINFVSERALDMVEFRGRAPSPNCQIYLAFILLEKVG